MITYYDDFTKLISSRPAKRKENQYQNQQQKAQTDFAFDNPYFKEQEGDDGETVDKGKTRSSINKKNSIRSLKQSELSTKGKKLKSGKNPFTFGGGAGKKQRALDDTCLTVEPVRTTVALRGHDFTGLGFNICGNMRDGILVKDVLHRGPASESGLIKAGDKIISVTVSFTNIVYEDALTILSYASPYDVQLEIERTPDTSRTMQTTPLGSKRLGSCSFNNSGQKLFHPLYRSQSIDDLTQIDKDTLPSHGLGPRRSQSVGVAAHKLAAHFKNSDSKLEKKEHNPSVVLSITGSLNEKMLANVMTDGNLHNGLQWEKRFEDTLESEDIKIHERRTPDKDVKVDIVKDITSTSDSASSISEDEITEIENHRQKISDTVSHTPVQKQEIYKSAMKSENNHGNNSQTHPHEHVDGKRAKTMAEASNALWQLDHSIKNNNILASNSPHISESRDLPPPKNCTPKTKIKKLTENEEGNESDVSRDSLELSNKIKGRRYTPQTHTTGDVVSHYKNNVKESHMVNSQHKPNYQQKYSKAHHNDVPRNKVQRNEMDQFQNSERIYTNSVINKNAVSHKNIINTHVCTEETTEKIDKDRSSNQERMHTEHNNPTSKQLVYEKHRNMQDKASANRNSPKSANDTFNNYGRINGENIYQDRQQLRNCENFLHSYGSGNKTAVNNDADQKHKLQQNSKYGYTQKIVPVNYHMQTHEDITKHETTIRPSENESKLYLNQQKFIRKNPVGTFTQINPFQQPARQRNVDLKVWNRKEDKSKEILTNGEACYTTTCDSSGQQFRREAMPSSHLHNQRTLERQF
ncbi:uncharacterized protein LOC118199314 [Stegodyphus dumicola]|uniref:uncharacterized protein LOC118199314 n=1 Tax=Stegodyphus dumicola TaxID=202533 RepID=UPI0015AA850C|nr:uncharacterized protein LOC118199314 [Stegodyphus dumicola]